MKKLVAFILSFVILLNLSGCQLGGKEVYVSTGSGISNAFTIGTLKCPKKEASLYIASFVDYYEAMGISPLGMEAIVNERRTIESALSLMTRIYSLNLYATQNDLKLSNDEENRVSDAANEYYKSVKHSGNSLELTESDIKNAYQRYALALKVYESLMEGVDSDVTEDEARVMEAYVLFITDEGKVPEIDARIKAGDDFATITQVYSEGSKRVVTFGRNQYPKEFDEAAFSLEDGQVSERVETEDGIYYVMCTKKYDENKSEENKALIIDKRQKALLKQIETEQSESNYSDINKSFFDGINLSDLKLSVGKDFFITIEKYL